MTPAAEGPEGEFPEAATFVNVTEEKREEYANKLDREHFLILTREILLTDYFQL